jgi:hypothetical protein
MYNVKDDDNSFDDSRAMVGSDWAEDDWDILIDSLIKHKCILMLGPEIKTEEFNGELRPLKEILSYQLAQETKKKEINDYDLAEVAENHIRQHNGKRNKLEKEVVEFYNSKKDEIIEIYKNLAKLPFPLIISSSHDDRLVEALEREKRKPVYQWYNFRGRKGEHEQEAGTIQNPLVFNLFGSIKKPKSLVLSEQDILDFLAAFISGTSPLPKYIKSELKNKEKSFLFIGFGLKNRYFRVLFSHLREEKRDIPSFAIEKAEPAKNRDYFNIFFYKNEWYNIHIQERNTLDSFVQELCRRVNDYTPKKIPTVFLCYCEEDEKFAEDLRKKLKANDIELWRDNNNRRGKDYRGAECKPIIMEKIDYFLILRSKTLASRYESPENIEINCALKRQERFFDRHFIIHIKIEDCEYSEKLEKLPQIDLSDKKSEEQEIKKLVSIIHEDYERR